LAVARNTHPKGEDAFWSKFYDPNTQLPKSIDFREQGQEKRLPNWQPFL